MSDTSLRKIVVDSDAFLWKSDHAYVSDQTNSRDYSALCTFSAFREGNKQGPLRIKFETWEDAVVGAPLNFGVRVNFNGRETELNLNHPSLAAELIRYALRRGWRPAEKKPYLLNDGIAILIELGFDAGSLRKSHRW